MSVAFTPSADLVPPSPFDVARVSEPESFEPIAHLLMKGLEADGVRRVLRTVRKHLQMDVAFVSRFRSEDRIFEYVDDDGQGPIAPGQTMSMEEGYCLKVVSGELPQCMPDTSRVPAAFDLPATAAVPIGSHLSVPVRLESGQIYGTLCCFGYQPNPKLGERDVQMMQAFAEVLAYRIDETIAADRIRRRTGDEIRILLTRGAPRMVYQAIHRIDDGAVVGYECLARFDAEPRRRPDEWFAVAHRAGIGVELELQAIQNALEAQVLMPEGLYLAINASVEALLSERLAEVLARVDLRRTVVELTEHGAVDDYDRLADTLRPWRERGLRLAIDDAGAGYASMRHILKLDPDIIKLDMSLTHDIDCDRKRRALAKGLTAFAHDIGALVTAEGVETEGELETLRELGVDQAQGYHLARPESLGDALARVVPEAPTGTDDEGGTGFGF